MEKKILAFIMPFLMLACSLTYGSSRSVEGSGISASQSRDLKPFSKVEIEGFADVAISFGELQSVIVETDDNILSLVETRVRGDTLIIGHPPRTDLNPKLGIRITIVMESLESASIPGSGSVTISEVSSPDNVEFSLPGSGTIRAGGQARSVSANIRGSGDILCQNLHADTAEVRIGGSGNVTVFASQSLNVNIGGSGTVRYAGSPASVDQSITGSGSVTAIP